MRMTLSGRALAVLAGLALLTAFGCGRHDGGPQGGESETESRIYVGKLKSGFVAGGGEHTGWMLERDRKEGPDLEADISAVVARAKELDGTRVKAVGTMYEKTYVERGTVQILKIDSLQPAAPQ